MIREKHRIRICFDNVCGGLKASDGKTLKGFLIAGKDRHFVWADAQIEENSVIVFSEGIADPEAVRYAWADNPKCNLVNIHGLPAGPFRTDRWPGLREVKK